MTRRETEILDHVLYRLSNKKIARVLNVPEATVKFHVSNIFPSQESTVGKGLESHTYDALGRGLSSSRANGVGSVTVSYPQ